MSGFTITKSKIVALGSTAAVGIGIAVVVGSGAYFSASAPLAVSGTTGNLSVQVNNAATNTAAIKFDNVLPGVTEEQSFTVKNTGSTAATVSIGEPVDITSLTGNPLLVSNNHLGQLEVGVKGYQDLTPITSFTPNSIINLGTLKPNAEATYTVQVQLSQDAKDDWQNAHVGGTVTVNLEQAH